MARLLMAVTFLRRGVVLLGVVTAALGLGPRPATAQHALGAAICPRGGAGRLWGFRVWVDAPTVDGHGTGKARRDFVDSPWEKQPARVVISPTSDGEGLQMEFRDQIEILLRQRTKPVMSFWRTQGSESLLVGRSTDPQCPRVFLWVVSVADDQVRADPGQYVEFQAAVVTYLERSQAEEAEAAYESERRARVAAGNLPPELRSDGGPLGEARYDYWIAEMDPSVPTNSHLGVRPVDEWFQKLRDGGYKCLSSHDRFLAAGEQVDSVLARHRGRRTYVLECAGDCRSLRYRLQRGVDPLGSDYGYHLGKGAPLPAINISAGPTGRTLDFYWVFSWPEPLAERTRVRIYEWDRTPTVSGRGCTFDEMFDEFRVRGRGPGP